VRIASRTSVQPSLDVPSASLDLSRYSVLPANRTYVSHEVARIIRLFYPLSRHIEGSESQNPPAELNQLIKDKITKQDTKYKQLLKLFKFGIDAESTIHLIFEGKPLESV